MNQTYSIASVRQVILIGLALIFSVPAICQDLTEAQRAERCQNNKNRIAELETQLKVINADFSASMTKKEMEDARTQMAFIKSMKVVSESSPSQDARINRVAAQYNFDYNLCFANRSAADYSAEKECLTELEKLIAKKIDRAKSLNRAALLTKRNETEKQIKNHKTNLVALGCNSASSGSWAGTWVRSGRSGKGAFTLSGSGNAISGTEVYSESDWTSTSEISGCKTAGENKVSCNWTNQYSDVDKSLTCAGTIEMALSGNTISTTWKEVGLPQITWKPKVSQYSVSHIWNNGAVWNQAYTRK